MRKILSSSLSSLLYQGGRLFGQEEAGVRVLCYHQVNDESKDYITVSIASFREQMRFLAAEGYQSIGLGELLNGAFNDEGRKRIVITFDDGYRDNFENAFPIMKELGFGGTIFCIGNRIGETPYLTRQNILEMQRAGFDFGSHTLSHSHLRTLSAEGKKAEISGSKRYLEDLLGSRVDFFCYPFGEYDQESVNAVRDAGYLAACSNQPGSNSEIANPYLLRRTEIGASDTLVEFKKKLAGAYDWMHRALHAVRGRS